MVRTQTFEIRSPIKYPFFFDSDDLFNKVGRRFSLLTNKIFMRCDIMKVSLS